MLSDWLVKTKKGSVYWVRCEKNGVVVDCSGEIKGAVGKLMSWLIVNFDISGLSFVGTDLKVKGIVRNVCKECGRDFYKAYYEGETEECGKGSYCLGCILGVEKK